MPQKDFELVLRVQADLQNAVKELRGLNDQMRVTKTSAQQASGGIDELNRSTKSAVTGIGSIDARLKAMGGTVNAATGHLKTLAAAIGVAFVVHKVADFTRSLVDANEQLFQLAKQAEGLNVSVKFFSGLTQQADDLGIGVQQIAVVMGTLNRQLATAKRGSATAKGMFEIFGIDPDEINSTEDAFLGVADSVAKYGLNAQRAGVLTQIFGTSGKDIVPILKEGAAAIREQNDAMAKTGQIITDAQVPAIVQLHDATDRIGDAFTALRNNLIVQLAPAISQVADQFNEFVTTHGPELIKQITDLAAKLPEIARDFGDIASKAFEAANAIAGFIHYASNVNSGAKAGDVAGLSVEQSDIEAELRQRAAHPLLSGVNSFLAGTENNALQNTLEAGRPRIQAMSTAELQKRLATIQTQLIQARIDAAKPKEQPNPQEGDLRGLFVGESPGGTSPGTPNPAVAKQAAAIAKQAAAAQDDLTQALISLQGQLDPTAAAWANYNAAVAKANADAEQAKRAPGANAAVIDAQRDAVIALHAAIRDAALDQIAEKDRQAWEALKRSFETPAQVAVEDALKKIAQLNDLLKKGVINSGEYHDALGKIGAASVTQAPQYQGLDASVGGIGSELTKNFRASDALEAWYQQQLDSGRNFHATSEAEEEAHQARMEEIDRQYAQQRNVIEQARGQLTLQTSANLFGQLATLSSSHNRKIAAIGKAAAIAQTIINTYQSATEAYASLASIPYIGPALGAAAAAAAIAAGLANVAQIRAQSVGGYKGGGEVRGPGTGTSDSVPILASNGEFMQSEAAVRYYGVDFMEAVNRRMFPRYADGGLVAHPLASVPSPAALGFANPARLPVSVAADSSIAAIAGMGSGQGGGDQTHIHVWSIEQAAEELAKVPSFQKAVVHIAGENPRAIQGKWQG